MKKILFALFIFSLLILSACGSPTGQVIRDTTPNCKDVEVPYELQEEYMKTEYYTETVPYTDQECENKELVYRSSIDEMDRDKYCSRDHEECENYFLGICTDWETVCDEYKEICSFDITNLDEERGTWYFEWYKRCRSNQPLCSLDGPTKIYGHSLTLDPTETKTTSTTITYDAEGQEYCYATFNLIPNKEICRDVIKYEEVQRERQVTAYRPVTKYRTETKCG